MITGRRLAIGRGRICRPGGEGLIYPIAEDDYDDYQWPDSVRAFLYVLALIYLFLGVNVASDRFMSSIERITSKRRRVFRKATQRWVTEQVWNDTVANLTLLALGSSGPEILLSVVEIFRNGFESGALGPSTIIGSAAFNLLIVVAVCIVAIPSTELRKIKKNRVFALTASLSLFAYFWLLFIVQVSSPGEIHVWEAVLTLAFAPGLVLVSYLADIRFQRPSRRFDRELSESAPDEPGTPVNPAGILIFSEEEREVMVGSESKDVLVPVFRRAGSVGTVSCKFKLESLNAVPGLDFVADEGTLTFEPGVVRKEVCVQLLPKRPGADSDCLQLILEEPEGGVSFDPSTDGGSGKAILTLTIVNSQEADTAWVRATRSTDRMLNVESMRASLTFWREDIWNSFAEVDGEEGERGIRDWTIHIISVPWKLACAVLIPPPYFAGGWVCFTFSLLFIGGITAVVIDFAELFGCVTGIEDSITAITIVAAGTSMPDLFASITAARQDETADASIVNVTGSNCVNVFLGIGLPWTIASLYWSMQGKVLEVQAGNIAFGVLVFSSAAIICLVLLRVRRVRLGGELGGPFGFKVFSAGLLLFLWATYISLSVWRAQADIGDISSALTVACLALFGVECLLSGLALLAHFARVKPKVAKDDSDVESAIPREVESSLASVTNSASASLTVYRRKGKVSFKVVVLVCVAAIKLQRQSGDEFYAFAQVADEPQDDEDGLTDAQRMH